MAAAVAPDRNSSHSLENQFLAHLPRLESHARHALRHIRCPEKKSDLLAEIVALAWKRFTALARRGRDPGAFITTLALRCSQAVRAGRRLTGSDSATDVLSPLTRARRGFQVLGYADAPPDDGILSEALGDNTQSEVPDQAAFRIDFPRWRARLGDRDRQVLSRLMVGEGSGRVAREFGLSPGRVSQMRRAFKQNWDAFHAEPVAPC